MVFYRIGGLLYFNALNLLPQSLWRPSISTSGLDFTERLASEKTGGQTEDDKILYGLILFIGELQTRAQAPIWTFLELEKKAEMVFPTHKESTALHTVASLQQTPK